MTVKISLPKQIKFIKTFLRKKFCKKNLSPASRVMFYKRLLFGSQK